MANHERTKWPLAVRTSATISLLLASVVPMVVHAGWCTDVTRWTSGCVAHPLTWYVNCRRPGPGYVKSNPEWARCGAGGRIFCEKRTRVCCTGWTGPSCNLGTKASTAALCMKCVVAFTT